MLKANCHTVFPTKIRNTNLIVSTHLEVFLLNISPLMMIRIRALYLCSGSGYATLRLNQHLLMTLDSFS